MKLLENKTAIITGATRGIGRGIALEYAKQGAHVAFTYSSSVDAANDLEKELSSLGIKAKGYQSNAADFDAAQADVQQVYLEVNRLAGWLSMRTLDLEETEKLKAAVLNASEQTESE